MSDLSNHIPDSMLEAAKQFKAQGYTTISLAHLRNRIEQARQGYMEYLNKDWPERARWSSCRRFDTKNGKMKPDDGDLLKDPNDDDDDKDTFHVREDYEDILVRENGVSPTAKEYVWVRNLVNLNVDLHHAMLPFYDALGQVIDPKIPALMVQPIAKLHSVVRLNAYRAPRADAQERNGGNGSRWLQVGQSHRDRSFMTVALFESKKYNGQPDPHSRLQWYGGAYRTPSDGIFEPTDEMKRETARMRDADSGSWHNLSPTPEEAVVFASAGMEKEFRIPSLIHRVESEEGYPCERFTAIYFPHRGHQSQGMPSSNHIF